jgi:polar amino acid transport system permease protein
VLLGVLGGLKRFVIRHRGIMIATASTAVVFTAIAFAVVNAPGWPEFKSAFLDRHIFGTTFGEIARAFLLNVKIFLISEPIILVLALGVAIVRNVPGPALFPFRLLAVVYVDLFRGLPTILVMLMLGLGMPALGISWLPSSSTFWAVVTLVLIYTAYVSEVYRAGIDSVHPSQEMAARSIGLSRFQGLRYVIVPQAVRRVIPPLLNDFIGLQKDTALISVLGAIDVLNQAQIDEAATFNFTPFLCAAVLFVAITIPLTRFTDHLIERERARRQTAGVLA